MGSKKETKVEVKEVDDTTPATNDLTTPEEEVSKEEAQPPKAAGEFTEEEVLRVMIQNGGKDIKSSQIRDLFGLDKESGRDKVRRIMKKLEKDKKVKIHVNKKSKRKQFLYDVI